MSKRNFFLNDSGQLQNMKSSLIYTGPCFIQIEYGQCGLKPLVSETVPEIWEVFNHRYSF